MLTDLCKELNNWFEPKDKNGKPYGRLFRTFTVADGSLEIPEAQEGQYVRICDSVFNDGVYQYPLYNLTDETFDGAVWLMAVPQEIIELDEEIDAWKERYEDFLQSPYQSESFGGYSYTKASSYAGNVSSQSGMITWQSVFSDRLSHWRKV